MIELKRDTNDLLCIRVQKKSKNSHCILLSNDSIPNAPSLLMVDDRVIFGTMGDMVYNFVFYIL